MKNEKMHTTPTAVCVAVAAALALMSMTATPALADSSDELRAELAAQRARLEALEQKLEAATKDAAVAKESVAKAAAAPKSSVTGLTYQTDKDTVSLYGLLDLTLSSVDNADSKGNRKTTYQTPWFSGSRWGITGKHDLSSDGLASIFRLESEYVIPTGEMDTPGVLFNRDAWVGFESDGLGKLTFGRQNTLARDFSQNYGDAYGSAGVRMDEGGWTNTNNFKQLIYYAGSATGTRYDRGVVWKKTYANGIVAGLGYQFGGVAGAFSKGTTDSLGLAYNGGAFNVSGFYNQANVNGGSQSSYSIGGNYQLAPLVRVNAGYFHYTADQGSNLAQRKDNAYTVSTKLTPGGKMDYELGYQVLKANNAGQSSSGNTLNPFADATAVTTVGTGDKKTFYVSTFYHFDSRNELYLAADYMKLNGGYVVAVANGFKNQTELAMGFRTRF